MRNVIPFSFLSGALLLAAPILAAKGGETTPGSDHIDVIAHFSLSGGPVVQLSSGVHWRRNYLYLSHGSGNPVTILDVTDPTTPKPSGTLDLPKQQADGNVSAAVGSAVLVSSSTAAPVPQTVTILSFADAEHPQVVQQFSQVTSMLKDPSRGLIYLTNPQGLWVLRLDPATDLQLQKDYDHYLRYYR